jgi:hypothetical protein
VLFLQQESAVILQIAAVDRAKMREKPIWLTLCLSEASRKHSKERPL